MRQLKITKSITNRESASLDKYLQEIGREDLITVEEEVELAQRIRKGDRVALEKLTRANLRFVVSVAKQYQNQGLSLPDLINEGNLGLIKAAEKFDETRGFKFISYAVWWIRQSILQALAEQSRIVRLPLNQVGYTDADNEVVIYLDHNDQFEKVISRSKLETQQGRDIAGVLISWSLGTVLLIFAIRYCENKYCWQFKLFWKWYDRFIRNKDLDIEEFINIYETELRRRSCQMV